MGLVHWYLYLTLDFSDRMNSLSENFSVIYCIEVDNKRIYEVTHWDNHGGLLYREEL